jgi:class 3 adenylate cyclase/tetratricopeptide (TPR) repeat protein/DNA-binding XRE family transcriptional regulator
MIDTASFGDWIRRRRKALDLTREALAQQVGCAVVTIRKIESDERRPSRQIAERLAECLQVPADQRAAFLQAARAELAADRLPDPPAPPPLAIPSPAPAHPSIAPCPSCGAAVPAGRRFCAQCGAATTRACPTCGATQAVGARFCDSCGSVLDPAAPPQAAAPRDERRWATVLFADISGFTARSEQMDPEDVKALVDRCTHQMSEVVRQLGGTVLQIIGDEVMAVFGAPVAHEDDPERAVRASLALRDLPLADDGGRPLQVHIGITTGELLAGALGPQGGRDYTVMGDTVNTAARLRDAAPAGQIYVDRATYHATQRAVRYDQRDPIAAKGKGQPVPAWAALSVAAVPQARPLGAAPLIGRDEELDRLLRMWARVTDDAQPHLVTIMGEPDIGKSRLVAEFERRLPAGVAIWHGRCLPYGEALSYWALAQALKEAAGIIAEDSADAARAKLAALVAQAIELAEERAELAQQLALLSGLDVAADRTQGAGDQRILHAAARRFLEAYARGRPLCLIIDDLHWADDALLDLVESAAARVRDVPLMIIAKARPELLEKRASWGCSVRSFTSLPLGALKAAAEQALALALCHERHLPADLAAQVGGRAGGNPLFVEEVVAMLAEAGHAVGVPSAIKPLIAARLDALPTPERSALQLAAVLGKTFWAGGVRALQPHTIGELAETLDTLEQKDLLRAAVRSQLRGDREYSFKHDLIRDVAYERLPKTERRALHDGAANWLEQAAGEQVENYYDQLAHHAVQAGQQDRALGYLMRAAERAGYAAAHRQVAALLGQAVAIAESLGQRAALADLHARRGKAFIAVGMWREAKSELEAALVKLAPEHREQRVRILVDMTMVDFWLLDMASLRRHATEALALAEAAQRDDLAGIAIAALGLAESSDGNLQAAEDRYERGVARAGEVLISPLPSAPRLGLSDYWLGRSAEAIPRVHRAIELARGDTSATMFSLPHLGLAFAGTGQYVEAVRVFDEARRFGREYEVWPFLARAIAMSAGFHLDVFDFVGNEALVEEARELGRSANFLPPVVSASIDLLLNLARRQEVGRAEKLVDEIGTAAEKAAGFHGWLWRLRLAEARAEIALARGDWEETLRLVEGAIGQSRARGRVKYHALGLETRAGALAALGRTREAIVDLRSAAELARPTGDPAMFLRAAAALLALDGDDALLAEARAAASQIAVALLDDAMRTIFEASEPVWRVRRNASW